MQSDPEIYQEAAKRLQSGRPDLALAWLEAHRIRLWRVEGGLRLSAPDGLAGPELAALLAAHKDDLRAALREQAREIGPLGSTALHRAASQGHDSEVRRLLDNGAELDARDVHGQTALHQAAEQGYLPTVNLLLERGADPANLDMYERTPLYAAVALGRLDVAERLLQAGSPVNRGDFVGLTPLGMSIGYEYPEMQALLEGWGGQMDDLTSHTQQEKIFAGFAVRILKAHPQERQRHSIRVALIARWIGLQQGLDERSLWDLFWGGYLHDMGKQLYPEWVLLKPQAELSDYEREALRHHGELAYQSLEPQDLPYDVKDLVRYHHERWDGSGYLAGLKGNEIPRKAQIMGLADRVDHLREAGLSLDELKQALETERDRGFCGSLLDPLLATLDELQMSLGFQCSWWEDFSDLEG